ncbi:ABC-2 type transport system permease protein [Sinosporangium album]|uniref:ABC-2 type transport system permease protein n=1 Tax=Sinosporangium album TaxID=504805 RepID=A0A1G8GIR0_9ACTN|nr:ABC transporter permease [Sinosporangium album]SDH94289.1 ABC-2 type transport system permease protein [Sinosporangium album]
MKVTAIGLLNLRRVFRDRANIFFVIITPFVMIFVMGLFFGGNQQLRLGVTGASGPLAERLATAFDSGDVRVERVGDADALRADVERGRLHSGVIIPATYDSDVQSGKQSEVRLITRPNDWGAVDLGSWVRTAVQQEAALLKAARFAAQERGDSFDDALRTVATATVPGIDVQVSAGGRAAVPSGLSQFAVSAPPLLLLYTFLTAMTTAIGLVQARTSGVLRRMYASPTPARSLVAGEAAGRLIISLVQGLLIMLGSALLFGVDWGDPLGAAAILLLFSLIGGGAALLLGSMRSEGGALSLGVVLGLGLGALGGTMVPLETFSGTLRTIAMFTPHAWGYEGFAELVRHGAGILDILPQLGVLAAFAAVLFTLGVWRLRRVLVAGN